MKTILYWEKADRLVYLDEKATSEYWDTRWEAKGRPKPVTSSHEVIRVTARYLEPGAKILEGGCGRANKVKAMKDAGYDTIGIDFAEKTVRQAKTYFEDIDVRVGDVRSLEFPNCYFDGYWSLGVIEHFWTGYESILAEAARVLKPQGLLFLTAPWFSPYRRYKARHSGYPNFNSMDEPDSFYQFALGRKEVCTQLERYGFQLVLWHGRSSAISMKDDMTVFKNQINWLLDAQGSFIKRILRRLITTLLNPYCGHTFLAVARRTSAAEDS